MEDYLEIIMNNFREYHRRMFIFETKSIHLLNDFISKYSESRSDKFSVLLSGKGELEDEKWAIELMGSLPDNIKGKYVSFKDLNQILGTTWDFLIIDLRKDLRPNDVGRLVEVVRGGGLIFVLAPNRENWRNMVTPFHIDMVTSPYTIHDVKPIFQKHFVDSLSSSYGIFYVKSNGDLEGEDIQYPEFKRDKPVLPDHYTFDVKIYEKAISQDQVDVINKIDRLSSIDKGSIIVTADRGRGKSAAVGIGVAGLMYKLSKPDKPKLKILVTSPDPVNAKEIFNFISIIFGELGVKHTKKKHDGTIIEINSVLGQVRYLPPPQVLRNRADLVVVDEASGIPTHILQNIARKFDKTIYSSTLHGYEGAGRGFQVRFLPLIRSIYRDKLFEIHMSEPVRYAPYDPIEKWLFETLFLNSDPYDFSEKDISKIKPSRVRYVKINLEDWLFNKKDLLKEFIGIYIYAHYRNRPNDIMILCDAPHHFARCLTYKGHIVNSLHLAYEGGLTKRDLIKTLSGKPPSGHLIPTVLIRYYPMLRELADLKGIRIVRIATHPDLMNRGIGSRALRYIENEAKEEGVDWIGASFGAAEELISFWGRNGYMPLYLSPVRNQVSGEFSTIVVKPLTNRARILFHKARLEFKKLFITTLLESHFNLEPKIAYSLLSLDKWVFNYKPRLRFGQKERLKMYIYGGMAFGGAFDAIREVVKAHFIRSPDKRIYLNRKIEYMLIMRVLQARPWERVADYFEMDVNEVVERVREAIGKLRLFYVLGED